MGKSTPEWRKATAENSRSKGNCVRCASVRLPTSNSFCEKHYLQDVSHKALGTRHGWSILKSLLEEQNYECYYSGVKLTLGVNASIDHIKSRVLFPELSKESTNLRWTDIRVNRMKREMLEEEFLDLCSKIVAKVQVA